ncbi:MAG: GHKL domain-containing protein [Bacteroidetes bacterium]|nr:MAG: GHKL domain-containing protein [Bacteroidota bacterium]
MIRLFFLFLFGIPFWLGAQGIQAQIDSLRGILPYQEGEAKLVVLFQLSELHAQRSPQTARDYASDALGLAFSLDNPARLAQAFDVMGRSYHALGKYILATDCFKRGLETAKPLENAKLDAHLYNSLGIIMSKRGNYHDALDYFLKAKAYWEKRQNHGETAKLLINISALYLELEAYQKAIDAADQVVQLLGEKPTSRKMLPAVAMALNNIGSAHEGLGLYDQALDYYLRAWELKQASPRPINQVSTLASMFSVLHKQKRYYDAEERYEQAMRIAREENSRYWQQNLMQIYGDYLRSRGAAADAVVQYEQSLQLARFLHAQQACLDLNHRLAETHAELGDFSSAYRYAQRQIVLKDSLMNSENQLHLQELDAIYKLEDMEKTIGELRQKEELGRWQLYGLMGVAILFVIALFTVYSRYRLGRRSHRLLEQQHREIRQQNLLLEDKNRQIARQHAQMEDQSRAIRQQNDRLEASNRDLENFAYVASHDLKEPLRTLIGYLQLLERRNGDRLDESGRTFLDFARRGGEQMLELLEDLLHYSRVGRGGAEPTRVSLAKVLEDVQQNLSKQIKDTGAILTIGLMPVVSGYQTELYLLFQNLLSNSIKFHRPEVLPQIHIQAREEADGYVISVADNGIGIDLNFQAEAFTMFKKLHQSHEYQGTGIGLATCKKIVENHGGEISLTSEAGQGTTIYIWLPRVEAASVSNTLGTA